ncbi:hypothetical protein EDD30_2208 [Couchioplanes caeruleus]|uniref:DUF304 domain-containing protein n=2 Tax=Couchioplanes caeruleus TaxID=56438 RepID=A0A1K0G670_9ACTN|nr:hypothetical protein BG844_18755 [Couchioplanes caeruleus subsp. caeruleus]ROP29415.1 hypothetical protein EDD30_2208 [Couchioplanes caeruleus]
MEQDPRQAPAATGPAGAPVPEAVAALAATHGLGSLELARKGQNPFANFGLGIGAAAALFGIAALINWSLEFIPFRPLAFIAVLFVIGALFCVLMAFAALFAGFTADYLYAGGLVHTKNGRAQVVAWPDVDMLRVRFKKDDPTRALAYELVALDGRKVPVTAHTEDTLGTRLQQVVAGLNRPVVDWVKEKS